MNNQTKQPLALYYLFSVEFWERFGFYTVRGLLVLYLTKVLLFSDQRAYGLFAGFTALLWLTPAIGGYWADKILGYRWSVALGGVILTGGYISLVFDNQACFYLGLALLILGMGFFKSNVASLVGTLYGKSDPRRDGGFTIYYMGINLGGLASAAIAGYIVELYGWHAGFLFAAFGMLLGLVVFLLGMPLLGDKGRSPITATFVEFVKSKFSLYTFLVCISLGLILYFLMYQIALATLSLEVIGSVIIVAYLYETFKQTRHDRNKMIACLILTAFSIAFWVLYQQAPMTLNLFTERNVDRALFGHIIPTISFQSLNPFFIVLFTPFLNYFWSNLGRKNIVFSTALKFSVAILLMGIGFLVLRWSITYFANDGMVSLWWIVLSYALQSLGELMLQPIGLAMMTAMAPKNLSGLMIGTWFLASAISNAIAGSVATLANVPQSVVSPLHSASIYGHAFAVYGWWAVGVSLIAFLLVPSISTVMGERRVVRLDD